ncbi:MAG TPA: hypothetical protein P5081_00840 [Phycisphaerae bacterium]|nr:hypothetical protein [Phycisphaerae bacterium]HRW51398.1 hypothetical protein [Phycisphaerae bacterium]
MSVRFHRAVAPALSTIVFAVAATLLMATANPCAAEIVEFSVDPAQTVIRNTRTVLFAGTPLGSTLQGPGSDLAACTGALFVDLTPTSVQLLDGSVIIAGNSGAWFPGLDYSNYPGDLESPTGYTHTAEPANYGVITDLTPLGQVNGTQGMSPSCVRFLEVSLVDESPKPLDCGYFDEGGTSTDFTSGAVFYASGGTPPITDLVNTVSPQNTASVPAEAGVGGASETQRLTIPFSSLTTYFVNFLVIQFRLEGVIVATREVPLNTGVADLDSNMAVDMADVDIFLECLAGPDVGPPACECRPADFNGDQRVDMLDFASLQRYYPGSN